MKFDDSGHLERFRVNLEQVDGDLKETRSFVMKLNEETDMFSFDGMIKGAESIVQHLDKTKNAVNKTAEEVNAAKIKMQTEGIQGKINTGDYETQVNRLIAETQRWTNENGEARVSTSNLSNALVELNSVNTQLNTAEGNTIANHERLIAAEQRLSEEIKKTKNSVSLLKTEMATDKQINNLRNNIQKFYDINSKASKEAKAQLSGFISELDKGSVTKARLDQINNSFKQLEGTLRQTGNLGKNWFDTLKANAGSFVPWLTTTGAIMKGVQAVKDGISTVKELDYTLVDLRKTANMTSQQLNDFYYTSNDVAKQMGVTTQEIIEQASEFSRLGYNTAEQATKMAEYSSMFKMISPGMDISQATDGLVSVMKAKIFYQFLNAFVYRNMYIANI